jgi:type II secretory pathway pseudopilin PulG
LLIVIVIIGILAALVIVVYTGIQNLAYDTTVKQDLRNIGQKIQLYNSDNGIFPPYSSFTSGSLNLKATKSAYTTAPSANMALCASSVNYAVVAKSKSGNKFSYSSIDGLKTFTGAMAGIATTCAESGIISSDPGYFGDWGYNSGGSGTWYSWIGG